MYDRPDLPELLDAVRAHLEDQIIPLLKDRDDRKLYFQTLVALNLLRVAGRELVMDAEHLQAEWARLNYLQNTAAPLPSDTDAAHSALEERNRALADRIAAGDYDQHPRKAALFEHLLATVHAQLQVANPRFLETLALQDAERERRR